MADRYFLSKRVYSIPIQIKATNSRTFSGFGFDPAGGFVEEGGGFDFGDPFPEGGGLPDPPSQSVPVIGFPSPSSSLHTGRDVGELVGTEGAGIGAFDGLGVGTQLLPPQLPQDGKQEGETVRKLGRGEG